MSGQGCQGDSSQKDITVGGDGGYQGLQDDLPNHSLITPFKATKNRPVNQEEKLIARNLI